jgi:phosphate transport system protein
VVFRELIRILRSEDLAQELVRDFARMCELATTQVLRASEQFWHPPSSAEERRAIYAQDIEINRLQRTIRKRMVVLLVGSSQVERTSLLVLMSIAKDVERVGDYAKNLAEAADLCPERLPDDDLVHELADIRKLVQGMLEQAAAAVQHGNVASAKELTARGRGIVRRSDALIEATAHSDCAGALAVKLALGTRYYKRICCHMLNAVSSVIMPPHQLDYLDDRHLDDDLD